MIEEIAQVGVAFGIAERRGLHVGVEGEFLFESHQLIVEGALRNIFSKRRLHRRVVHLEHVLECLFRGFAFDQSGQKVIQSLRLAGTDKVVHKRPAFGVKNAARMAARL